MRKDIHMKYAAWNGFTASCRQHLPSKVLIIILAVITGLITGSGAHLLKCLVAWVSGPMTDGLNPDNANYTLLISPILGILLTGIFPTIYITAGNLPRSRPPKQKPGTS